MLPAAVAQGVYAVDPDVLRLDGIREEPHAVLGRRAELGIHHHGDASGRRLRRRTAEGQKNKKGCEDRYPDYCLAAHVTPSLENSTETCGVRIHDLDPKTDAGNWRPSWNPERSLEAD